MKYLCRLLLMGLVTSGLSACFQKHKAPSSDPLLKSFLHSTTACQIVPMPADVKLPCGIDRNPYLTTAQEELSCLVKNGDPISGLRLVQSTELVLTEAFFAVYKSPGEAGISAFRFASDADFAAFKNQLPKQFLSQPHSPLILGKNLAVFLWSDPGGENCFKELKQTIPETLNKLGLKE